MAENIKEIKTRIALKQQTYAQWTANTATGANYVPYYGEVCFCEIPAAPTAGNTEATTAPTVLFKVGDGTNKFSALKWASALAADVYEWAKLTWDEFQTRILPVITGAIAAGAELDETVAGNVKTINHETKLAGGFTGGATAGSATAAGSTVTIKVPKLTVNEYGHVTGASDVSYTITIPEAAAVNDGALTLKAGGGLSATQKEFTANDADNVTFEVSHGAKPTTGNAHTTTAGTGRTYVTKVDVDSYGHIAKVYTATETDQDLSDYQPKGDYKVIQTAVADKITNAAHVLDSLTQNENGEIAYTVKELTPDDIGAQPAGNYKTTQTAVSDPTASGKSLAFIDTISQNANGVISVTKKNVNLDAYALKTDIPSITITDDTSVDVPTTDTVNVYRNLTANGHTLTEDLVSVPTKAYVDKMAAGAVDYLGTLEATTGLSTTASKGDFYRVKTEIKSGATVLAFVGDLVIAEKNNPTQAIDGTNWTAIHCGDGDISNVEAGNGLTGGGATGSVTLSAKAGNGITVDANGIHHADTSTVTNVTKASRTYVAGLTFDNFGHVTGYETDTEVDVYRPIVVGDTTVLDYNNGAQLVFKEGNHITLTWESANNTIRIDGEEQFQAKNIVGASATAKANAAVTEATNSIYLNLIENDSVRSAINIVGAGATKVYSDANGKITIKSTDTWKALSASQDGYVSKDWYAPLNDWVSRFVKNPDDGPDYGYFVKDSFSVRNAYDPDNPDYHVYEYATLTPGKLALSEGDDSTYRSTTYAHRGIIQDINGENKYIALPDHGGLMAVIDENGYLGGVYGHEINSLVFGYDNFWAEIGKDGNGYGYLAVSNATDSYPATIWATYKPTGISVNNDSGTANSATFSFPRVNGAHEFVVAGSTEIVYYLNCN